MYVLIVGTKCQINQLYTKYFGTIVTDSIQISKMKIWCFFPFSVFFICCVSVPDFSSSCPSRQRKEGIFDDEALQITQQLLSSNPDFATLWNYRREILLHLESVK